MAGAPQWLPRPGHDAGRARDRDAAFASVAAMLRERRDIETAPAASPDDLMHR
jgi:hypothetical protein